MEGSSNIGGGGDGTTAGASRSTGRGVDIRG